MNRRKFIDKIAYSLRDSYGFDKLSKYLYVAGLLLSLISYTAMLGLTLAAYSTWRCFSKNKYKRYQELAAFERYVLNARKKFGKSKTNIIQLKDYKVFKCPKCSQKLRVPRGKGKITISCKKCSSEFKGRS